MEDRTTASDQAISADNDRERWLRWRKGGIGGSDAASVLGEGYAKNGKKRGPLDVYVDKVSESIEEVVSEEQALLFERGRELEPLVAARFERETGMKVRRQPVRVHRDHDFIRCSVDRQILAGETNPTGQLEIKTANAFVFRKMQLDGLPLHYWIQHQHNMEVYDYDFGWFCVLHPDSWKMLKFPVERDRDFCARLIEAEVDFWNGHVIPRIPPAPLAVASSGYADKMPTVTAGELVRADDLDAALHLQFIDLSESYKLARDLRDEAVTFYDGVKESFESWMLKNAFDVVEGNGRRFFYKEQAGRKSLDKTALVADHPTVRIADYEKSGKPFRSFRAFEV